MKAIFSNYNFTPNWIKEYNFDYHIFDRSDSKEFLKDFPQDRITYVKNIGSDILDKFNWIIENYSNLPDVVLLSKSNLMKYVTEEEFKKVKDNKTFTPLLTQNHITRFPVSYYDDGLYYEINNYFYLIPHPTKNQQSFKELRDLLTFTNREYLAFCPGSNYILTREDIQRHPKSLYIKLRSYLDWAIYPGECQMMERGLYFLWGTDTMVGI